MSDQNTEIYGQPEREGPGLELAGKEELLDSHFPRPFTSVWFKIVTGFFGLVTLWGGVGLLLGSAGFGTRPRFLFPFLVGWGLIWGLIYYVFYLPQKKRRKEAWELISKAVRDQKNKDGIDVAKLSKNSRFSQGKVHEMLLDAIDSGVVQGSLDLN